jgi:hypothetical protein
VIAEAIDTAVTLGWALAAWIAVIAAVTSIVLLAGTAVGMWAVRGAWRMLRGPVRASKGLRAVREPHGAQKPSGARTAPAWAQPDKEAA